jgi:branched-chain amino acid transport system permease protein
MADTILLAVLDGLSYAAVVFLVAVGLTLVFGVLRVLNVAHGSFYALGAYAAVSAGLWILGLGLSPWLTVPMLLLAAIGIGAPLGALVEGVVLRRIYAKEPVLQLLVTFAVFMILEDVQRKVWGATPYFMDAPVAMLGTVDVGEVSYTGYQLFLLPGVALLVLFGLRAFLRYSVQGRIIVAVTEDREASEASGINVSRIYLSTFVLGSVLACLGGALAAPTASVVPGLGADMIVLSFAVVATAGLGAIGGAAIAALLIGLGHAFAVYFAPTIEVLVPYLIMVLVLLFRPSGLFPAPATRRI